jgi:hypothetical protein
LLKGCYLIFKIPEDSKETRQFATQIQQGMSSIVGGMNAVNNLLIDHVRERDSKLYREHLRPPSRQLTLHHSGLLHIIEQQQRQLNRLSVEHEMARRSPSPLGIGWWPTPPQTQTPAPSWCLSPQALRRLIDAPDIDLEDMEFVDDRKADFRQGEVARAEQVTQTSHFQNLAVSPLSAKLLVQWDSRPPRTFAGISPLSAFCSSLTRTLRRTERFLAVVWFCGRHADPTDGGQYLGVQALLVGMIDQLLRQHEFDTGALHAEVSLPGLQARDLRELTRLLAWLVRRLPRTATLYFIVDGVAFYERDEFWDEAFDVFTQLLRLCGDETVSAAVKVLFTSTPGSDIVREGFEDDFILNVENMSSFGWAPNEERIARELDVHRSY